jgi:hypothetical protein
MDFKRSIGPNGLIDKPEHAHTQLTRRTVGITTPPVS